MSSNFQIDCRKRGGKLFVKPKGVFDGSSACELVNIIHDKYDGAGQIVIETEGLCELCPFGCTVFKCRLNSQQIPFKHVCFNGPNGYEIAPEGCPVRLARKASTYT